MFSTRNSPTERRGSTLTVPVQASFSPFSVTASKCDGAPTDPAVRKPVAAKDTGPRTVANGWARDWSANSTRACVTLRLPMRRARDGLAGLPGVAGCSAASRSSRSAKFSFPSGRMITPTWKPSSSTSLSTQSPSSEESASKFT